MLTFAQDGISRISENFEVLMDVGIPKTIKDDLHIPDGFEIEELHFVPNQGIENPHTWKPTSGDKVGESMYMTEAGVKIVLRFDLVDNVVSHYGRQKVGVGTDWKRKVHFQIPYLEESIRRGVSIEEPLGFMYVGNKRGGGNFFSIIKVAPGRKFTEHDLTHQNAFLQGMILQRCHSLGVFHGHPHDRNWIIDPDGLPKLVDGKILMLDIDLPHEFAKITLDTNLAAVSDTSRLKEVYEWRKNGTYDAFLDGYTINS